MDGDSYSTEGLTNMENVYEFKQEHAESSKRSTCPGSLPMNLQKIVQNTNRI